MKKVQKYISFGPKKQKNSKRQTQYPNHNKVQDRRGTVRRCRPFADGDIRPECTTSEGVPGIGSSRGGAKPGEAG